MDLASFYDIGDFGAADGEYEMAGLRGFRGVVMTGLDYQPNLGPVGSGDAYAPGDVTADAMALNYVIGAVDVPPPQQGKYGPGGAFDLDFQNAVKEFQLSAGLTGDGWIGPATRKALKAAVDAKNASGDQIVPADDQPLIAPNPTPDLPLPATVTPLPPPKPTPVHPTVPPAAGIPPLAMAVGVAGLLGGAYALWVAYEGRSKKRRAA